MKTQKLKFIMPTAALLLALAASAFTVLEQPKAEEDTLITGYYRPNPTAPCQDVQVNCIPGGAPTCTHNNLPVFEQISGTSCVKQLTKVTP